MSMRSYADQVWSEQQAWKKADPLGYYQARGEEHLRLWRWKHKQEQKEQSND